MQIRDPSIRTTLMHARNKVFDIVETDGLNETFTDSSWVWFVYVSFTV